MEICDQLKNGHEKVNGHIEKSLSTQQKAFETRIKYIRSAHEKFKWKLNYLAKLKREGKRAEDPQVKSVHDEAVNTLTIASSGMRTTIETVDAFKRKCMQQRSVTDDHNLSLQSYLYEIAHYNKQIDFCREYQTPQLSQVITKAKERVESSKQNGEGEVKMEVGLETMLKLCSDKKNGRT